MQPKTPRQQIPQRINNRPATQTRKHTSSLKTQTKASMTTEYRERFLPPSYFKAVVSSTAKKSPYHPLKGTRDEITSLRPIYVRHQWIKKPPKFPQPPEPDPSKDYRRCKSTQIIAANRSADQAPPRTDYTSVYQNDFKQWEVSKRQPFILKDSLTLKHGLGNLLVQQRETEPTGNTTSYKSDYVHHPAHPRPVKLKHSNQSSNDLPLEPRLPFKPSQAWSIHQDILDKASDFYEKFNSCSLETKFQGHAKDFTSPADHSVHCQASEQNLSTSGKKPQSFAPVKTAAGKPKFTDNCKASPKTLSRHAKINRTAGCNSTQDATRCFLASNAPRGTENPRCTGTATWGKERLGLQATACVDQTN